MRATAIVGGVAALLLSAVAMTPVTAQVAFAPHEPAVVRSQHWDIPWPGQRLLMHTTVLLPPGTGPFPLAVVNHGSSQSSVLRAQVPLPQYGMASQWLLDRGFAVALPLRPGHGATGGPYFEDQGRCDAPDYYKAGLATADSIEVAVDHLTAQPFIRKSDVLVVGQSAGGWGALALASRNPTMVRAVINFSGGRGGRANDQPNHNCMSDRLVESAGLFGRTARIPTLWLYAENDSYFGPSLSNRMYEAFSRAGGPAEYHLLPSFGVEGHPLIESRDAFALWATIAGNFLARHE